MSNRKKLKLAFVGGGINSAIGTTHKIAAQMDDKFELVCGCFSRDKKTNKETAGKWFIERYYESHKELYEKEKDNIDAVAILTPTDSHTEPIVDALEHNIPVISEKTITSSLEDALLIKSKILFSSFLVTTYNYTGYPMIRELQSMISSGKLGKIIQVHIEMPQESFIRIDATGNIPVPQKWRLRDDQISTVSLDLGTHLSNMVCFLTGKKPLEVIASLNSFGHYEVIDNITCLIRYSGQIDCRMWYGKSALGHKNGLKVEVYGTIGSAKWYQMNPEFLEFSDNLGRNIILDRSSQDITIANLSCYNRFKPGHPAGFIEAFANYYADCYTALCQFKKTGSYDNNLKYLSTIDDSIIDLRLMQAIEKSAKSRVWETVPNEN